MGLRVHLESVAHTGLREYPLDPLDTIKGDVLVCPGVGETHLSQDRTGLRCVVIDEAAAVQGCCRGNALGHSGRGTQRQAPAEAISVHARRSGHRLRTLVDPGEERAHVALPSVRRDAAIVLPHHLAAFFVGGILRVDPVRIQVDVARGPVIGVGRHDEVPLQRQAAARVRGGHCAIRMKSIRRTATGKGTPSSGCVTTLLINPLGGADVRVSCGRER